MRKIRTHAEGRVVHIHASSAVSRMIFSEDSHCLFFIEKVAMLAQEVEYEIYILCLLPKEFHLVIRTSGYSISCFMHRLQTAYAVYFNRRNNCTGHVFARRFSDQRVSGSRALIQLSRYIHLAPAFCSHTPELTVEEKIKNIRTYPWSSCRGYLGVGARHKFISYSEILKLFGSSDLDSTRAYREFLESPVRKERPHLRRYIDNPALCLSSSASTVYEEKNFRKVASPAKVMKFAESHFSVRLKLLQAPHYFVRERAWIGIILTERCGLTQSNAAKILGWNSNAALSIQMRNLRLKSSRDSEIENWMKSNLNAFSEFESKEGL